MKSERILIIIILLLITFALTNPSSDAHLDAVIKELDNTLPQSSVGNNQFETAGNTKSPNQSMVEKAIVRENIVFFSITKMKSLFEFGDRRYEPDKYIGWGILGNVFIFDDAFKQSNELFIEKQIFDKRNESIRIGNQEWMGNNLNMDVFRNGDKISEAKSPEEWEKAAKNQQPAWCYFENDPANGPKYGKLYNWYAVIDSRGLAPAGWHIPNDVEWTNLTSSLGDEKTAGKKMKSTFGWKENGNGTNESGFAGLPGGSRNFFGLFLASGNYGYWWSSTPHDAKFARTRYLNNTSNMVFRSHGIRGIGLSVRCIKD